MLFLTFHCKKNGKKNYKGFLQNSVLSFFYSFLLINSAVKWIALHLLTYEQIINKNGVFPFLVC